MAQTYDTASRGLLLTDYKGKLHLGLNMQMEAHLSQPFLMTCTLVSSQFSAQDQLGQKITCTWNELSGERQKEKRSFNGHIVEVNKHSCIDEFDEFDEFDDLFEYEIKVRPWFWLLKFSQKNRVFQKQTLSAIIKDIFDNAGFSGCYQLKNLPTTKRPFTLQYNETDFAFVRRLLSEQGVSYSFEHSKGKHSLVFHKVSAPFASGKVAQAGYAASAKGAMPMIDKWVHQLSAHGASVSLSGYDFTTSKAVMGTTKKSSHKMGNNTQLAIEQFPTDSVTGDLVDLKSDLADAALNRLDTGYDLVIAESHIDELELATTFKLAAHPDPDQKGDYSIVSIIHRLDASAQSVRYENEFTCMPKSDVYAPIYYAKPRIVGFQTAVVAGKTAGDPQHDADGNIKIQFSWDADGSDSPSCYVRVAQTMTGSGAGMQFIPRAGEEVLVSYINNDPDQPIVVGSLYNSTHKPPYAEANTTKIGIKTQPSATSNELRFDDKKDKEEFYQRAAKDMLTEVQNDSTLTITGKLTETVEKAISTTTNEGYTLKVEKTLTENAKEMVLEADSKITLKVGSNSIELSTSGITIKGSEITLDASGDASISGANLNMSAKANADLSASANLSLKANANATLSGAAGAKISTNGRFEASGMAGAEVKSMAMTSISGTAMTEIKGALVKIN